MTPRLDQRRLEGRHVVTIIVEAGVPTDWGEPVSARVQFPLVVRAAFSLYQSAPFASDVAPGRGASPPRRRVPPRLLIRHSTRRGLAALRQNRLLAPFILQSAFELQDVSRWSAPSIVSRFR